MTARPQLRGQGYMRKGGAAATQAHNATVRAHEAPEAAPRSAPTPSRPLTAAGRTDGRGSDRSAGSRTDRTYVVAACLAGAVGSSMGTSLAWAMALR